jgi:hypothetical protein
MKSTVLLLVLLGAALTAQAQSSMPGQTQKRDRYYQPEYQGGGIRGRYVALADGELLTPSEAEQINSEPVPPQQRQRGFVPGGSKPPMPILQPKERKVNSPFAIQVAFPPDAAIDSFRTYYGPQKVDITDRIAGHASKEGSGVQIDGSGVRMEKAQLPKGKHVLEFEVKTPQGPITSKLEIEVL